MNYTLNSGVVLTELFLLEWVLSLKIVSYFVYKNGTLWQFMYLFFYSFFVFILKVAAIKVKKQSIKWPKKS